MWCACDGGRCHNGGSGCCFMGVVMVVAVIFGGGQISRTWP